jgi:hypothetical protein
LRLLDETVEPDAFVLAERAEGVRIPLPRPSIAVVAAHDGARAVAMSELVGCAARAEGRPVVRWRAELRSRPGAEWEDAGEEWIVRASADAFAEAIETRAPAVPSGAVLVVTGAAFVAACRPTLAILITERASAVHWDPVVRAIRDRFDVVLSEPREALARRLVAGLR